MLRKKSATLDLYTASERSLHNREVLAVAAGRPRFKPREILHYIAVATVFPLVRVLWRSRFAKPSIEGPVLVFGSRKRSMFHEVLEGRCLLDDLEYDWVEDTWRFLDFRIVAVYYLQLFRHVPFILMLLWRRPAWSSAHFAVCLLERTYLRETLRRHPQVREIYCGYYADRKALLLTHICRELGVRHVGFQHGAFNIFPYLHRAYCDSVILIYEFSRPFASRFFAHVSPDDVRVDPGLFDLGWTRHSKNRRFIVYATSADQTEVNRKIVLALVEHLPSDVDLFIKPHPRDERANYADLVPHQCSGFLEKNAIDAVAYVGRLSSVMAEAHSFRVPIFIFGDGSGNTDFLRSVNPDLYTSEIALAHDVADLIASSSSGESPCK